MVRKYWPAARIEDIEDICRAFPRYLREGTSNLISKEAEWPKVLKMLLEEYRATGDAYTVQDYGDYLGWINALGITFIFSAMNFSRSSLSAFILAASSSFCSAST